MNRLFLLGVCNVENMVVYKVHIRVWFVDDGSICWFSSAIPWLFDCNDYPKEKGGDDIPCAFHTYECHKCGKKFGI